MQQIIRSNTSVNLSYGSGDLRCSLNISNTQPHQGRTYGRFCLRCTWIPWMLVADHRTNSAAVCSCPRGGKVCGNIAGGWSESQCDFISRGQRTASRCAECCGYPTPSSRLIPFTTILLKARKTMPTLVWVFFFVFLFI